MNSVKKQLSLLGVVATLALVFAGAAEAGKKLTLTVDVDEASFDVPDGIPGPFVVEGDAGGGPRSFQCWGWIHADESTNVTQVYIIPGRGSIMTQGIEGSLLAVTGGTGDFRNVRGEALQDFTGPDLDFTIEFDLKGAKKPKK